MKGKKEFVNRSTRNVVALAALALLIISGGATSLLARDSMPTSRNGEGQVATTQSKFYCNIKALTPAERAHLKQLGEKLKGARSEIVEMPKGYEFQFSPKDISLAELADWVSMESKCCPFFEFHIDLENEGKLLCLRLTGEEGIKAFIQNEFQLQEKK